jgi:hypothetical protein
MVGDRKPLVFIKTPFRERPFFVSRLEKRDPVVEEKKLNEGSSTVCTDPNLSNLN